MQMEWVYIYKVLMRRWWLVVIPTVLVGVWVAPSLFRQTTSPAPTYVTTFRYTAGQQRDAFGHIEGDLQDIWEASYKLVEALTAWIRTSSFRDEVASSATAKGLSIDGGQLQIVSDNQRPIGQITIYWHDVDELDQIINAVIDVLLDRNTAYFAPQLGGQKAHVILLDDPQITTAPPSLPNRFAPLIRLAIGILVGVVLAFLADYLDTTIRETKELKRLGLDVIGVLPRR
jgi:capsular polysaccharide biosynthesis protein